MLGHGPPTLSLHDRSFRSCRCGLMGSHSHRFSGVGSGDGGCWAQGSGCSVFLALALLHPGYAC